MKNKSISLVIAALCQCIISCNNNISYTINDGIYFVTKRNSPMIGTCQNPDSSIIMIDNKIFKDLNHNKKLDEYEDWRKPSSIRSVDLSQRLSIDEIIGLMLFSMNIPSKEFTKNQKTTFLDKKIRNICLTTISDNLEEIHWVNRLQSIAEMDSHGIPMCIVSDPRNGVRELEITMSNSLLDSKISFWPSPLGLAATFDPKIVEQFGQIASDEYRSLGITTALSPQIDIASEPRWNRFIDTYGENPLLVTDMTSAYVYGFQSSTGKCEIKDGWGYKSVNTMIKHWPGGGCGESGRDAHFSYGKYAVYPGKNLNEHIQPFTQGTLNRKDCHQSSSLMPYYTITYNQDTINNENVGNAYSQYFIDHLLRKTYGFNGIVCSDWGIFENCSSITEFATACWGVEDISIPERYLKLIIAGVDQFGGSDSAEDVLEAYNLGIERFGLQYMEQRMRETASRILNSMFRIGLFENPYLDIQNSINTIGKEEYMKCGYDAQVKSIIMLKNRKNILPLKSNAKVYIPKVWIEKKKSIVPFLNLDYHPNGHWGYPITIDLVKKYFFVTDNPNEADVALVFIDSPDSGSGYDEDDVRKGGNGYLPISLQYNDYTATYARETSIAGGDPLENFTNRSYKGKTTHTSNKRDLDVILNTRNIMKDKPVIVQVDADRPFIVSEFEKESDAILLGFGIQKQAVLDIISGKAEPSGLLPMQLPSNMRTVEEQFEDVPFDMECYIDEEGNSYDFAYGLNWDGIINDNRVEKYKHPK